jgi:hypothetical protein
MQEPASSFLNVLEGVIGAAQCRFQFKHLTFAIFRAQIHERRLIGFSGETISYGKPEDHFLEGDFSFLNQIQIQTKTLRGWREFPLQLHSG